MSSPSSETTVCNRRTTPSSWPSAFWRSFSAVTSASSRVCASCRARSSAALACDDLGAGRVKRPEVLGDERVEPFEVLRELARLALALEHPGGDGVTLPAFDAPVRVQHGAIERDEGRHRTGITNPPRAGQVADHDCVADQRAHERLVLRRKAQNVGQTGNEGVVGGTGPREAAPATKLGCCVTMAARPLRARASSSRSTTPRSTSWTTTSCSRAPRRPASAWVSSAGASTRSATRPATQASRVPTRALVPAPTPSRRACISSSAP